MLLTDRMVGAGAGAIVSAAVIAGALEGGPARARAGSGSAGRRSGGVCRAAAQPVGQLPRPGRRAVRGASIPLRGIVAALAALRPAGVLVGIILGGGVEQRADLVGHRRDRLGDLDELLAVPLLHEDRQVTVMVAAGELDRRREAVEPDLLQALGRDVEVLETATHVLARHDL